MKGVEFGIIVGIYVLLSIVSMRVNHIMRTVDAIASAMQVEADK